MNIFFDLDGTLVDASDRLYKLFQYLVPESRLSKDRYWELKRSKLNHGKILKAFFYYSDHQVSQFEAVWMKMIELPEWIQYDKPFDNTTEYLIKLRERHNIYVVTARQSEEMVTRQLAQYRWARLFEDVLVTRQREDKSDVIRRIATSSHDWMVGDTGKDIQEGKKAGLLTAGVLSGFLSREKLEEYNPQIIADRVVDLTFDIV